MKMTLGERIRSLRKARGIPKKAKKPPSGGIFYQVLAAKTPAFRHGDTAALKEYWTLTIDTPPPALAVGSVKFFVLQTF